MSKPLPPEIQASVDRYHARQGSEPPDAARRKGGTTVQLAVRISPDLRSRVHEAAAVSGAGSTQQWLEEVLAGAVEVALDPSRALAERIREHSLASIRKQIDAGWYEQFVRDISERDPDLSSW